MKELRDRLQGIQAKWDQAIHSPSASYRAEAFAEATTFADELIKALESEVHMRDYAQEEEKEARRAAMELQCQVDNFDVNLEQIKATFRSKIRKLEDALGKSQLSLAQHIFDYEVRLRDVSSDNAAPSTP